MGIYLNPGNDGFREILESSYVDKTGMIRLLNQTIGTRKKLTCVSRPRRFGKSFSAQMLCAYYDKSCDSRALFKDLRIAGDPSFGKHLNAYHVISLDITDFVSEAKSEGTPLSGVPSAIAAAVLRDIRNHYPELEGEASLSGCLLSLVRETNTKVVFVIDEWDSLIREARCDTLAQERYLNLLRGWFKNNNFTPYVVAAAYMTGILPIKKDGSQSAISDFEEYTMLDPGEFGRYVGFTEAEAASLCSRRGAEFGLIKKWYDGYTVGDLHSVYNPYSVMHAVDSGKYRSYWKKTSAAEALMTYIDMDQEGLQEEIVRLIAGESVVVDTDSFHNDVETFTCRDDILTLLIHLGYLTYEEVADPRLSEDGEAMTGFARIPNEEVRTEFKKILRKGKHKELIRLVNRSDQLLEDTLEGREDLVAQAIQSVHDSSCAPGFYNNEQSLRYVVKMAYISCVDQYARVEELPSGHGIADVVFIPKRQSPLPAMILELKWNKTAAGAVTQILDRNYPQVLASIGGDLLLVGINYDEATKKHTCSIERMLL